MVPIFPPSFYMRSGTLMQSSLALAAFHCDRELKVAVELSARAGSVRVSESNCVMVSDGDAL